MSQATPELLTAGEVAERFRVHPATITRWAKQGELQEIRIGRTIRFRSADVEALIAKPEDAA